MTYKANKRDNAFRFDTRRNITEEDVNRMKAKKAGRDRVSYSKNGGVSHSGGIRREDRTPDPDRTETPLRTFINTKRHPEF